MNATEILKAVSFPVELRPVYQKSGEHFITIPDKRAVVRKDTDECLAVNSDQYKLMPYAEDTMPLLEALEKRGGIFRDRAGRGVRQSPVRVESGGRRMWLETVFPEYAVRIGQDNIMPRLVLGNSYDASLAKRVIDGFWQGSCQNIGALHPRGLMMGTGGRNYTRRHIGFVDSDAEATGHYIEDFLSGFEKQGLEFQRMAECEVDETSANDIWLEMAGSRFTDKYPIEGGELNAWMLYSKVTNYLTFDYKGATAPAERRAAVALKKITEVMG